MDAEIQIDATDVELVTNRDGTGFLLRCQIVEQLPTGPQRSGKFVHLTITSKQAMRLLVLLHEAFDLPSPETLRKRY